MVAPWALATIRDKPGHSTSKHRLDMDLRKMAPALNAGLEDTTTSPACSTIVVGSSPSGGNSELSSLCVRTRPTTKHQRNPGKYRPCDRNRGQGQPSIRPSSSHFYVESELAVQQCVESVKTMAHSVANRCHTPISSASGWWKSPMAASGPPDARGATSFAMKGRPGSWPRASSSVGPAPRRIGVAYRIRELIDPAGWAVVLCDNPCEAEQPPRGREGASIGEGWRLGRQECCRRRRDN